MQTCKNCVLKILQSRIKGFFRAIFLDLFSIIFVKASLNVDFIQLYYLPKNIINDF